MSEVNRASRWDANDYARNASFVPALGAAVLDLLAAAPGERILDLGCGDGVLTERIVTAGAEVVGIDGSAAMVDAARARGIDARVVDGQAMEFAAEFDAVFSNAALHWMLDAPAVACGVFAALRPGGRFVGEMGGAGNIRRLRAAIRAEAEARGYPVPADDPQWYPTVEEFGAVYAAAGFIDIDARLIDRPTPVPAGPAAWFRTFRAGFLDSAKVPEAEQEAVAAAAAARLPADMTGPDGVFAADYVRLRFTMRKPD